LTLARHRSRFKISGARHGACSLAVSIFRASGLQPLMIHPVLPHRFGSHSATELGRDARGLRIAWGDLS
jgi:hypothetical protein